MLCGENGALKALDDAKAAIASAVNEGKSALSALEAQLGELESSLNDLIPEIPQFPDLQGELNKVIAKIQSGDIGLGIAADIQAIKDQFGEAVDDFEAMLADLGLDEFPPKLDFETIKAKLCDIPNKTVDGDGNVTDKPAEPYEATTFPAPLPPQFTIKSPAVFVAPPDTESDIISVPTDYEERDLAKQLEANPVPAGQANTLSAEELAFEPEPSDIAFEPKAEDILADDVINVSSSFAILNDAMAVAADTYPSDAFMPVEYYYWGFYSALWLDLPGPLFAKSFPKIPLPQTIGDLIMKESLGNPKPLLAEIPSKWIDQFYKGRSWGAGFKRYYEQFAAEQAASVSGKIATFKEAIRLYEENKF